MRHPSKDARRPGTSSRVVLLVVVLCGVMLVLGLWSHPGTSIVTTNQRQDSLRIDDGTDDPAVLMKPDPPERFEDPQGAELQKDDAASPLAHRVPLHSHYLTVVVMSYPKSSRFHLLEQIIRKCAKWEFVWEIILVWNGETGLLPPRIQTISREMPAKTSVGQDDLPHEKRVLQGKPFFTILPQTQNRVDNRWRIARSIDTAAVLNMDDDINLYTEGAKCMLDVWRASPSSLVAIDVRSHFVHGKAGGGPFGAFGYVARDRSAGFKQYSIALPRALLTHRDYYMAYDAAWNASNAGGGGTAAVGGGAGAAVGVQGVKQIVDELLCDDIAFNFVAAQTALRANEQLPGGHVIYAKARYAAYPESHSADGMTKKEGMKAMRQKCVNALAKFASASPQVVAGNGGQRTDGMILTHRPWHVLCEVDG